MNKLECKVCGFEFTPTKEAHYIARDGEKQTVLIAANPEPVLYEAWDCPLCGTQYSVKGRLRRWEPMEVDVMEEVEENGYK